MTQDKFVQTRRKREAYQGTPTDDNADGADLDKSNAQAINGRFLRSPETGRNGNGCIGDAVYDSAHIVFYDRRVQNTFHDI